MKNNILLKKNLTLICCSTLLMGTLPETAQASGPCAVDQGLTNPVAAKTCDCSSINGCGDGTWVTPFAGYHTCAENGNSGVMSCASDPTVSYYDTGLCTFAISYWGMAGCAAAIAIGAPTAVAVCFTAGVFSGGASCYAAIAAYGTGTIAACQFCATHNCSADATSTVHFLGYPSHPDANSGTCPG